LAHYGKSVPQLTFLKPSFVASINRENSAYIVKYNLHTQRTDAQISVSGYTARKNHYRWSGYSGMDLAVDEQGLWVLWGSTGNSYRLYAYKIDVYKNAVTHTWSLSTGKYTTFKNNDGLFKQWTTKFYGL